jgi:hypothetical protein
MVNCRKIKGHASLVKVIHNLNAVTDDLPTSQGYHLWTTFQGYMVPVLRHNTTWTPLSFPLEPTLNPHCNCALLINGNVHP